MLLPTQAPSAPSVAPSVAPSKAANSPVVDDQGKAILLWRRQSGRAERNQHAAEVRVGLDTLPQVERTWKDPQGGEKGTRELRLRGVALPVILQKAQSLVDGKVDTAVLRFKNGTRVPVPLQADKLEAFDVFVARAVFIGERWTSQFESVPLGPANYQAPRSLVFSGNRVFIGGREHLKSPAGGFEPTVFLDSLVEVELVNADAWRGVLDVGETANEKAGLGVFMNRCAWCHGVRGAGASLGWDFVNPMPLATWRKTPEALFDHVRNQKLQGAEQGLIMPAQHDVTLDEIKLLHAWMQRVGDKELKPYKAE